MVESIGRVRYEGRDAMNPLLKRREVSENIRAYRFPRPLARHSANVYTHELEHGLLTNRLKYARAHRAWYETINALTAKLKDLDVSSIQVRGRSKFLRIELRTGGLEYRDFGAQWNRIEKVMCEVTGLPIEKYVPKRFIW